MNKRKFSGYVKLYRVLICTMICIIFIPTLSFASQEAIRSVETDGMSIALTFDDGPNCAYTKKILDILDEFGIKATFFMIGTNVEREPELAAEVAARGHEIGNHTYEHDRPWRLDKAQLLCELTRTSDAIKKAGGTAPCLFRPPEGVISGFITPCAVEMGYNIILWSVDTRDWECRTTVDSVVSNIRENIHPGGIILCHDGVSRSDSVTPAALRIIIPELLEKGYNFVTVSELI